MKDEGLVQMNSQNIKYQKTDARFAQVQMNQARSGSKPKPYSATYNKKRVINENSAQVASTHATSFKPISMPTAHDSINK